MNAPPLVTERLGEEEPLVTVPLGGADAVYVTPTRTLVYRADGLLSDESVAAFPHDAERVDLRVGRRKATVRFTYVDDAREFTVPSSQVAAVLDPVLGGVLRARAVLDPDEHVVGSFRFSELTLIVSESRVAKHVGSAVWDDDHETYPFEALTGLDYEEGRVATQVVIEVDGRPHRVKVPNDEFGGVRKTIEEAVFAYHGVDSRKALNEKVGVEHDESDAVSQFTSLVGGDEDEEAEEPADDIDTVAATDDPFEFPDTKAATADADAEADDLAAQVAALTEAVARQNELLEQQGETIERLVDELRRGR